jgi:hypothetical protein
MIGAPRFAPAARWAPHEMPRPARGRERAAEAAAIRPPDTRPSHVVPMGGRSKPSAAPASPKPPRQRSGGGIRCAMLERWLAEATTGAVYCYHRGELARDRLHDPDLAAVADRLLELSTGRFDLVSGCGHVRGEIVGDGTLELLTKRIRGETVYLARKRPPAASA